MSKQQLQIRMFGSLLIERDGHVVDGFVTVKAALLFCYLALNPGKHKRESLAAFFWSDTPDSQAFKNLRTILSSLRKTVPEFLIIDSEWVEVKGDIFIDTQIFEGLYERLAAGTKLPFDEMLIGVDVYTADFLQDVHVRQAEGLDSWIQSKRDLLQQKYLQFLYLAIERCFELGELYRGLEIARHLVRLNPLWEAAQRQLMLLLVHLNQSGEALMQYERLVTLLKTELETEVEDETIELYQKIKGRMIQASVKKNPRNIILPDLPYVIPGEPVRTLREILDKGDARLISLVGLAGAGKSSLAMFIAHERRSFYPDGVVIVPLATVTDRPGLAKTILASLNIAVAGRDLEDQVLEELNEREMLLVLDNYEQLLPETGLIKRILEEAACVQLLVSSQTALNLREERVLTLTGLQILNAVDSEAVQLFKLTAERILPSFDLQAYRDTVFAICQELEGWPLGIVIAASQVKYISPAEILRTLRKDILAMEVAYQDMPKRHQSFASLIQASLEKLSTEERQTLAALTIFRGSFEVAAALEITNSKMQTFISLADKSLIQSIGNFRYTLHGVFRTALRDELESLADKDLIRQRFTAYYRNWCQWLYQQRLPSIETLPIINIEYPNIWHLDLLSAFEQERYLLEICSILQQYWLNHGFVDEVIETLKTAIKNPEHPIGLRSRGMVEVAMIVIVRGEQALAQSLAEDALAIASDNLYIHVQALQVFARIAMQRGQHHKAIEYLENVLKLERHKERSDDSNMDFLFIGNHIGMGLCFMNLGNNTLARNHFNIAMSSWTSLNLPPRLDVLNNLAILDVREEAFEAAREKYLRIIAEAKRVANVQFVIASGNLGELLMKTGEYSEAFDLLTKAVNGAFRIKRLPSLLYHLETLTRLFYLVKNYTIAVQLQGFTQKSYEEHKLALAPKTLEETKAYAHKAQAHLGEDYWQLLELGKKLSLEAAIALVETNRV